MDAVDGVAHILARGNDHREGEKDHRADAPMQAEHGGVDVNMADLNQGLESEEYVEHGATSRANLDPAVGGSANTELNGLSTAVATCTIGIKRHQGSKARCVVQCSTQCTGLSLA